MKLEYDIVEAFSVAEMIREMQKALADGWQCQGGLSVTPSAEFKSGSPNFEGLIFHQAIVREVQEKKPSGAVGF